jgi:hypothetical protein
VLRHTVMFRWKTDTTPEQVAAIEEGLAGLPGAIDTVRSFRFGRDAAINEGNFDFVVTADFDDRDGYLVYRDHPAHMAVVVERIRPQIADRAAVQFEH